MKKLAIFFMALLLCVVVFRYAVGNNRPITDTIFSIEFDNVGDIMKELQETISKIEIVFDDESSGNDNQSRLYVWIEYYSNRGGQWIRDFADRLPGIFSNTKDALYIVSKSNWANGNETWAIVQGYFAYIAEQVKYARQSIKLTGKLVAASAGKLVEVVIKVLFS